MILVFAALCIFSVNYINSSNEELFTCLSSCADAAEKEDFKLLDSEYMRLNDTWYKKRKIYNIVLHKNYTNEFNRYIENMQLYLKHGNYLKIIEITEECKRELEQISEREKINFENIL